MAGGDSGKGRTPALPYSSLPSIPHSSRKASITNGEALKVSPCPSISCLHLSPLPCPSMQRRELCQISHACTAAFRLQNWHGRKRKDIETEEEKTGTGEKRQAAAAPWRVHEKRHGMLAAALLKTLFEEKGGLLIWPCIPRWCVTCCVW